jgi:serine protease Do
MRPSSIIPSFCLLLGACATTPPQTSVYPTGGGEFRDPIDVAGRVVDTVVFAGVDLSPFIGAAVGYHHEGLLKVRQYAISPTPQDVQTWTNSIREIGTQLLRGNGYALLETGRVFSAYQDYGAARYVIGAKGSGFRYDSYGALAGNSHAVALQLDWEVLDTRSKRVVFSKSYSAAASGARSEALGARISENVVSQLLADSAFVRSLGGLQQPAVVAANTLSSTAVSWPRAAPLESEIITLTTSGRNAVEGGSVFERAADAVVALTADKGLGTAFLISREGLALTNEHVVAGRRELRARLKGGKEYPVRVIRADRDADVALIEIACASECRTIDLAPRHPAVGDDVVAIGTPLSQTFGQSLTKGVVSGLRRRGPVTLIQTDAAVNPGNSGGPLLDAKTGRVLGVVSSKIVGRDVEGMAFAVTITDALRTLGVQP